MLRTEIRFSLTPGFANSDDKNVTQSLFNRQKILVVLTILALLLSGCGNAIDPAESLARGKQLLADGELAAALIELKNAVQGAPEDPNARAELGNAYLLATKPDAALKELKRARSLGHNTPTLNQNITRAHILSGQMDEAATELALHSDDESAQWLTLQGLLDLAVGRFEEARGQFERALALDEKNVDARRGAIRAAIGLGDVSAARGEIERALAVTEEDFDIWILKGDIDRHDQDLDGARLAYDRALNLIPNSPLALLQRASVRAAQDDSDGALSDLNAIGEASNEDPRALFLRALIARKQGQDNAALRYLKQILVALPKHRTSLEQAAMIHFEAEEFSQAEDYVERLLALDPAKGEYQRLLTSIQLAAGRLGNLSEVGELTNSNIDSIADPSLLALLGTAYIRHGDTEKGERSLERAKDLAPDSSPIKTQLAFSRMRSGNIDQALAELAEIRRDDPEFLLAGVLEAFGLAAAKRDSDALAAANALIESHTEEPILYNLRGYLLAAQEDMVAAKSDFEAAVKLDQRFFPAYFNLARLAAKAENYDEAAKYLDSVLDMSPEQPQALMYLASLRLSAGEEDQAVALWQRAREQNPDAVEARVLLARHHRGQNDLRAALAAAEEAYALAPFMPAAQFEYTVLKLSSNEPEAALVAIEALGARFPESAVPLEFAARAHEAMGNMGSLRTTLDKLIENFPEHTNAKVSLARLHLKRSEYAEALGVVKEIRKDEAFAAQSYNLEGEIYYAQGEKKRAADALRRAHELQPDGQSVVRLNAIQSELGIDEGLIDKWLELHPDDAGVRLVKATADIGAGKYDKAIADYEQVLAAQPKNFMALNNLAWLYDEKEDERAVEYARKAYELAPEQAAVIDTYGWILFRAGKQEQAIAHLRDAAERAPDNKDIVFHYASALAKAGDSEAAMTHLERILGDEQVFQSRDEAVALRASLKP